MGILIRDAEGVVLAASCEKLNLGRDIVPWIAGAIATLNFAFDVRFFDIVYKGSQSPFINQLFCRPGGSTVQDMRVMNIRDLIEKFRTCALVAVHKDCNKGAKLLAQLSAKSGFPNVWLEDFSLEILNIL